MRSIEAFTKTIVVSGEIWGDRIVESHAGLEDISDLPPYNPSDGVLAKPNTEMLPEHILSYIRGALSRFLYLDGLEWYGRFAGDYYLVRYLQGTGAIRHLTYGIDEASNKSIAYCRYAFLFRGLKSLIIMGESEPTRRTLPAIVEMMHNNSGLEKIIFDCKFTSSTFSIRSLMMMISDESQPERPIFIWRKLRHLVLRSFKGPLWQSAPNVDRFTQFFVAHPNIETLVISTTHDGNFDWEVTHPFSLSSHPETLPRLKILLGSSRLISGILESTAACSSVVSVIQDWEDIFARKQDIEPHLDRINAAIQHVPSNQITRLRLNEAELNHAVYAKFARIIPQVQFLELFGFIGDTTASRADGFDPLVEIPAGLNKFAQLDTIGIHIARGYVEKMGGSMKQATLKLAKQVPRMKSLHCGNGALISFVRDLDGNPVFSKGTSYMGNREYDWTDERGSWIHRPISRRAYKEMRKAERA